jgi:hypothetical protein
MNYADSNAALRETTAIISFVDLEDPRTRHQNTWPKHQPQTDEQGL